MPHTSRDRSPGAREALLEKHSSSPSSSSSSLEPHDDGTLCASCGHRPGRRICSFGQRSLCVTYIILVLFFTSVFLFLSARSVLPPPHISALEVFKATSAYSPIFDLVDLAPVSVVVDGRLHVPTNSSSVVRGAPSEEADALWNELAAESYEVILVNASVLERAGYNPAHYFQAPLSWGKGPGQFPVQIDVFHQIHCLNTIRKQMYSRRYYPEKLPDNPDDMHWMHQRHCLHMLLQSLTCTANVDIVPHRWVEKDDKPLAQFSIHRQCRNFDNLQTWNRKNAIENVQSIWPANKESMPRDAYVWPGYGEEVR